MVLSPPGGGLEPNTLYHVRLVLTRLFLAPIRTAAKTFTTLAVPPLVETTGSPVRTATAARLDGRVSPRNSETTYYFEYGTEGPCDLNPCISTAPELVGSGGEFVLVSQQLKDLDPDTTYNYRLVADNGNPGSPVFGEDMTLTTFASDAALSHGPLPGPPGSDRAWEQVNLPDTSGNPIVGALAISDEGDRAVYSVAGGTPLSELGTGLGGTQHFAERTVSGWQTRKAHPRRSQAAENFWTLGGGPSDLSEFVASNYPTTSVGELSVWRMSPSGSPSMVYKISASSGTTHWTSDDGSRVVASLKGSLDPDHPTPPAAANLYDISSGSPKLISLLPDGSGSCGVATFTFSTGFPTAVALRSPHWLSADGTLAFFRSSCSGPETLYVREIEAGVTKAISGGPCGSSLIKSTPTAAFFLTRNALVEEDVSASSCSAGGGNDVYRYDLDDESLDCVTCVASDVDADVVASFTTTIGVAEDGSRVYFTSANRLLPGAVASGGTYRVNVASGDLAYVGAGIEIGDDQATRAMTPDGSVAVFASSSAGLNALGGQQNGTTMQYYRYDDRDRSLVCVSCPTDGSLPRAGVGGSLGSMGMGPNTKPLDEDGGTIAFDTPASLVSADQNTASVGRDPQVGTDVYEWREGRLLLVTDGLTNWPVSGSATEVPRVSGVTPSGRDVFFTAPAQLTPDALDGYRRLYDARIGGGFEFPPPPRPCPLEVCQGTPKGAPEGLLSGTSAFRGPARFNPKSTRCRKPKVRRKGRCVAKRQRRAKSSRGRTTAPNRRDSR